MDDSNEYGTVFPLSHYKRIFGELSKGRKIESFRKNDLEINYAEEQLRLVSEHRRSKNNLSEEVHPDNNKAPGCLSHTCSRIRYHCTMLDERVKLITWVMVFSIVALHGIYLISKLAPSSPYLLEICKTYTDYELYTVPMMTKEYGIEFYVKSRDGFDKMYPVGTRARAHIENVIMSHYVRLVLRYCSYELEWHVRRPDFPTPICNELQTLPIHT